MEVESRLIVGRRVDNAPNDKEQLVPTLGAVEAAAGPVAEVLIDSGFVSEAAVQAVERDAASKHTGVKVLAAIERQPHGRTPQKLEDRACFALNALISSPETVAAQCATRK